MKKITFLVMFVVASLFLQAQTINTFPWTESFETAVPPTADWTHIGDDGTSTGKGWTKNDGSEHGPGSVADGSSAAMFDCYNIQNLKQASLITPTLDLSVLSAASLSFSIQCESGSVPNPKFIVELSIDGGNSYTEILNKEADGAWDDWTEQQVSLNTTSSNCKIKFTAISDYGYKNLFLDNLKVYQPAPMQYKAAQVFQNNTEVVYTGSEQNELIGIKINTEGGLTPLSLDEILFSLNGTTAPTSDVTKLQLFHTAEKSEFSVESLVGEITTFSAGDISLVLTSPVTLAEGDNYFWLTANVSAAATGGNTIDAECKTLKINGEDKVPTITAPVGYREIKKAYIMATGSNEMTIDSEYLFYDDGGPEANYSTGFEGTITFKPQDSNKKIKIDWDTFRVFVYQSDPSLNWDKNDIFKVYNGSNADEANLIDRYYGYSDATAFEQENVIPTSIISTATDGALTVYFKVNTGMPKEGWSAKVTQVEPADMIYVSSEVTSFTEEGTVSTEDTGIKLLKLAVTAENTENPIKIDKITLDLTGTTVVTPTDFSKFTVYATGTTPNFSDTKVVGELTPSDGNTAEITFPVPDALQHSTNYYWITCDVSANALHGNILKAKITNFNYTGNATAVVPTNSNLQVSKTIDNTYVMPISGTDTKEIGNKIGFVDSGGANANYKSGNSLATVTFTPKNVGEKIIMSFTPDDFEIYFSSSSYGTKALFEIYSGDATSTDLLWEVDENNKSEGPGKIKSKAADGSITIKFNPNTSSSYYTKKGWIAEVWSKAPTDMAFESSTTDQIMGTVKPGSECQQILKVNLVLNGELNPISTSTFTFNTEGTTASADIVNAKLFFTQSNNVFTTTTQVGTTVDDPNGDFTFTCTEDLAEGDNYFWLVYDIATNATVDNEVDARLSKIKLGDAAEQIIANGNPVGNRIVKNIYLMQEGEHTVNVTNSLMFYDNGGADENYSSGAEEIVTFIPNAGQVIKLNFIEFNTRYNEYFYVYNGNSKTAPEIAKLKGSNLPVNIISTATDGSLTISFDPNYSYNSGWEIEVSSYTPLPLQVASIKSTALSTEKILKGATNEQMLKVEVEIEGDKGNLNLNQFNFSAENSTNTAEIVVANLYFTDTVSTFSAVQKFGDRANTAPFHFEGTTEITKSGVYKFWLTYDIATDATVNNVFEAKLTDVQLASASQTISENATASRTLEAGFSGIYTVGNASADYTTLADAIAAMADGIDGKVVFNIEAGTYDEEIKIPHIAGASSENTITIQSASGNYTDVVFEKNIYSSPAYGEEKNGMFTVYGADYLTVKGISFKSTAAFPSLINVKNISQYVTIENCFLQAPKVTGYTGISLVDVEGKNVANSNCDYFTLKNSTLDGGRIGIEFQGTGYIKLPKQKGGKALNNTFTNQGGMCIYVTKEHDAIIDGNIITITGETASTFKAIDAVMIGNTIIRNNRLNVSAENDVIGIYIREKDENETLMGRNQIYNNEIIVSSTTTGSYDLVAGIEFTDAGIANTDVVYNSINILAATVSKASAIYLSDNGTPTNNVIKNNILQNNAGQYVYYFNKETHLSGFTIDNNAVYTSGTNIAYAGSDVASFDDWKTKSSATNSINEQAIFLSNESLYLKSLGSMNMGTTLDFVATDINGETRDVNTPTVGAYEYTESMMPEFVTSYPKAVENITHNTADVKVKLTENGKVLFIAKKTSEGTPSQTDVLSATATNFVKNVEQTLQADNLEALTEYKLYFVLQDINGENPSAVTASEAFTTSSRPTEVSTFEDVSTTGIFTDGTAQFEGFEVIDITDGQGVNNHKAAKMTANEATATITNNTDGLVLNGFYFKSDTDVTLSAKKGTEDVGTKNLAATADKWVFINLKDLNEITGIKLTGTGTILIDNFSGEPQPITFMLEDKIANEGESVTISSDIYGGVIPYTYEWKNAKNEVLSTTDELTLTANQTSKITLTVTDAWDSTYTAKSIVKVNGTSKVATFDDLYLAPETHWNGDVENGGQTTFYSGSYAFENYFSVQYSSWEGFGYSNETSTNYTGNYITGQYNSSVGHGVNNSENYSIVYVSSYSGPVKVSVTNTEDATTVSGFYITNSAWVKYVSENGTGMASNDDPEDNTPFGKDDWYKITITADNGNTKDVYLADYRSENENDHYTLDTWQWVDLTDMGEIKNVSFAANGTRENNYGSTIPFYFCMDDFGGKRNETLIAEQTVPLSSTRNIDISSWFATDAIPTVQYTLLENEYTTSNTVVSLSNSTLNVQGNLMGVDTVCIKAWQKGKSWFVKVPLKVVEGFTISATANPTEGGSVEGVGTYNAGETATLTATTNTAYNFVNWTENGTEVSTNSTYSFEVTADRVLVANFAEQVETFTISATANPTEGGSVEGVGAYNAGETATLTATTNTAYNFVNWTENGTEVSTNSTYSFEVTADRVLVANFAEQVETFTISATANPTEGGSVEGAGTYNAGETATLTATANTGYNFVNWTENGIEVSKDETYSFNVTGNRTLVANFKNYDGINSNVSSNSIDVYPNPVADKITISCFGKLDNIQILDFEGRLLKEKSDLGLNKVSFIVNDLHEGIYFIRITTDNEKIVKRFIKE